MKIGVNTGLPSLFSSATSQVAGVSSSPWLLAYSDYEMFWKKGGNKLLQKGRVDTRFYKAN